MPRFCQLKLAWSSYVFCVVTVSISFMKCIFVLGFLMLYTEDFSICQVFANQVNAKLDHDQINCRSINEKQKHSYIAFIL